MSRELSPVTKSVNVSPVAYFSGEGLVAPTRVLRTQLDDKSSVYFLNPIEGSKSHFEEPTVALAVEETGNPSNKQVEDLLVNEPDRENVDYIAKTLANAAMPTLKLAFESSNSDRGKITPVHLAMLAHAAFAHALPVAETGQINDEAEMLTPDNMPTKNVYLFDAVSNYRNPEYAIAGYARHILDMLNITATHEKSL
jgi:hypothetical protein